MIDDYDKSIHLNPSAKAWAEFFVETLKKHNPQIDEGYMIGWFANAMMAMHDHVSSELESLRTQLTAAKAENEQLKEAVIDMYSCLKRIKLENLDDKTTNRFLVSLKKWQDDVCGLSYHTARKHKDLITKINKGE